MRYPIALAAALLAAPFASAAAQGPSWALPRVGTPPRFTVGAVALGAAPRGEFRDNVGKGLQGGGFTGYGLMRLDGIGILSLRAEGSGVWYGSEKQRVAVFSPRVAANVVTTNAIGAFAIGPELAVPVGPVRPYVNATWGVHAFSTSSSLEGTHDANGNTDNFSTKNQGDATSAWGFGGGLRIPLGGRATDFAIDLGTKYYNGGRAEYLTKGDIIDNADGTLTLLTRNSRTSFQTFYLGVSFGLHSSMSSNRWN